MISSKKTSIFHTFSVILICRITENVCEVKCARVTFVVLWLRMMFDFCKTRFKRICEVLIFKTTITYMITFARSRHINCPHYIGLDKKCKLFDYKKRTMLCYVQGRNFEKDTSLSLPIPDILPSRTSLRVIESTRQPANAVSTNTIFIITTKLSSFHAKRTTVCFKEKIQVIV